jgi:hypothetical protein
VIGQGGEGYPCMAASRESSSELVAARTVAWPGSRSLSKDGQVWIMQGANAKHEDGDGGRSGTDGSAAGRQWTRAALCDELSARWLMWPRHDMA